MSLIWLGVIGSVLTVIGFWLAFTLATKRTDDDEKEKQEKKKYKNLFTWLR